MLRWRTRPCKELARRGPSLAPLLIVLLLLLDPTLPAAICLLILLIRSKSLQVFILLHARGLLCCCPKSWSCWLQLSLKDVIIERHSFRLEAWTAAGWSAESVVVAGAEVHAAEASAVGVGVVEVHAAEVRAAGSSAVEVRAAAAHAAAPGPHQHGSNAASRSLFSANGS